MTSLSLVDISKGYTLNGERRSVLSRFAIEVRGPNIVSIVGPNGCGKSTLLGIIAGFIRPDGGEVRIRTSHELKPRIGFAWQDYRSSLLPWRDAADNITFPLELQGYPRPMRREIAKDLIRETGAKIRPDQKCYELSGGQQQIVSVLRSTVGDPDLLLFDEPLSALDQSSTWSMIFRFERIWSRLQVPLFFVSHDVDAAIILADEIVLMGSHAGDVGTLQNHMPHPRTIEMLNSDEHRQCRQSVIEFLAGESASRERA